MSTTDLASTTDGPAVGARAERVVRALDPEREVFERYYGSSRRNRGLARRPTFERFADDTYADDATQRHWWTWQQAMNAERKKAAAVIEECLSALAEELAGWDLDPPLHHVKQAHDKCVAWLKRSNVEVTCPQGRGETNE